MKVKVIQLDDAGDSDDGNDECAPPDHGIEDRRADRFLDHAADDRGLDGRQRSRASRTSRLAPMPVNEARAKWSVVMPQPVPLMAKVMFEHMKKNNVKTVGLIGFSDSWGDLWLNEFKNQGVPMGLELVADERFARPDTSVAGQVLKLVSGQAGRRAGRRIRHRRGPAAGDAARAQLRRA